MLLVHKPFLLFLILDATSSYHPTDECQCGYGGLCLKGFEDVDDSICKLCDYISGNFYENCSEIRDNCDPWPCLNNGYCHRTFGSFYCECPGGYFGKRCEIYEPSLQNLGISSEVRAYHQLQPEPDGTNIFHIIYDPGDPKRLIEEGLEVRINVSLSDGRVFFPVRGRQIHWNDTHALCLNDGARNPALYDSRLCELVPRGKSWTYTIDVTNYHGYYNASLSGYVRTQYGMVGLNGSLFITVELINHFNGAKYLLFDEKYSYFDYKKYRRAHNCTGRIIFHGCSNNKEKPKVYSRGHYLKIAAVRKKEGCLGTLPIGVEWFIQRNLENHVEYHYDATPVYFENLGGEAFALIPRRTLDPGLHMILYAEALRGTPPHYGSTREFKIYGRCWVRVVVSEPLMRVEGGAEFFARCQTRLTLPVAMEDPSYVANDFKYSGTCDHMNDAECAQCPVQGASVGKVYTPCGETYNFTIVLARKANYAEFKTQATVHFHEADVELKISCIFNCLPIDVRRRVLLRAYFRPYVSGPVEWRTFLENNMLNGSDGHFNIFPNTTASRIIRLNGLRFVRAGHFYSNVLFRVQRYNSAGQLRLVTSYKTLSVDLNYFIESFTLEDYNNGTYHFNLTTDLDPVYKPIRYRVYSIFNSTKGLFIEVDTTHKSELTFLPSGDAVSICMINPYYFEACLPRIPIQLRVNDRYKASLEDLSEMLDSGDGFNFIGSAVVFLQKHIINNGTHMWWNISLGKRMELLKILHNMLEQHDVMVAISFITMYFWSEYGNDYAGLPIFVEDPEIASVYHKAVGWMKLRYEALNALKKVAQFFVRYIPPKYQFKQLMCPEGSTLNLLVRVWALAYLQGNLKDTSETADELLLGEMDFWSKYTFEAMEKLSSLIGDIVSKLVVPHYGLRLFGLKHVRVYQMSTTYSGILKYLDRSVPPTENWPRYTDYVFGPPNQTDETWWEEMELEFPQISWNYSELFSLVVFVAENRADDRPVTPILYLELRSTGSGKPLLTLPHNLSYFVTFPTLLAGEKNNFMYFTKHTIVQPGKKDPSKPWRYMLAIKSTLPVAFQDFWVVLIKQYNHAVGREWVLKAKVFVDSQPDYVDMADAAPLTGDFSVETNKSTSTVRVYPRKGETEVSKVYYLGLILDDSVKPGSYEVGVPTYARICEVDSTESEVKNICKGRQKQSNRTSKLDLSKVQCVCSHFGTTYAVFQSLRQVQLFYEPIKPIFPEPGATLVIICCAAVLTCALLLLVTAFLLDVRRASADQYHYVEDAFPSDKYMVLVGVYTGMHLLAGSWSHVAIKLIGSKSSSRVHILNKKLMKYKQAFSRMKDGWFVIPVKEPLGTITTVYLWHDFYLVSDWYCSRLIIFDIESSAWYFVDVERWFKLYEDDEDSKMVELTAEELNEAREEVDNHEETYVNYYFRELQNTHVPLSAFTLHPRYIGFYEQKCLIFLVKVFGLFFFAWLLQGVGFNTVFREYDKAHRRLTRVSGNTLPMLIAITLLSRGFSFPCSSAYRWYVRFRNVQYKTTNPLISIYPHRRSRSLSRRPSRASSVGRTSRASVVRRRSRVSTVGRGPTLKTISLSPDSVMNAADSSRSKTAVNVKQSSRSGRSSSPGRSSPPSRASRPRKSTYRFFSFSNSRSNRLECLSFFFGPSQFRSVNADMHYFRNRMHLQLGARFVVGTILLSLCAFFVYAEIFTQHWTVYRQSLFFVMMGLLLDAVIFEPLFIFFKTLTAFSFLQFSHTEKYFYDDSEKLRENGNLPVTYEEYLELATKSYYKPFSSTQLVKKRSEQKTLRIALVALFYLCVLIVAYNACRQIPLVSRLSLWVSRRSVEYLYTTSNEVHGVMGPAITDVHNRESYLSYIITNFLTPNFTRMSNMKLKNVSANGSKNVNNVNFCDCALHLDGEISHENILFSHTKGLHIHPTSAEPTIKSSIRLANTFRHYKVTYPIESIRAGSNQFYPFEGITWEIPINPWVAFYSTLRKDLVDLFEDADGGDFAIRAVILSNTCWLPYLPAFMTVDLLFEDRPDGILGAFVKVQNIQVDDYDGRYPRTDKLPEIIFRLANCILFFCIFFANIIILSKVGIRAYFTTLRCVINLLFLVAAFLSGMSSGFLYYHKFKALESVVNNPTDVYTDAHRIYFYSDLVDGTITCFLGFMALVEGAAALGWLFTTKRFILSAAGSVRIAFAMTALILTAFELFTVVHSNSFSDARLFPLMPTVMFMEFLPTIPANQWYWSPYFLILLIVLIIITKGCRARIIYLYLSVKLPEHPEKLQPITTKNLFMQLKKLRVRPTHHSSTSSRAPTPSVEITSKKSSRHSNKSLEARQKFSENTNRKYWFF